MWVFGFTPVFLFLLKKSMRPNIRFWALNFYIGLSLLYLYFGSVFAFGLFLCVFLRRCF